MKTVSLPNPTKKRFIQLLRILQKCKDKKITSIAISEATGWKSSLIRHDLWLIGFNKGVSDGYFVKELADAIGQALKVSENDKTYDNDSEQKENNTFYANKSIISSPVKKLSYKVCIVGLGRLGAALLDWNFFENSVFEICAGFDSNVNRVEILRSTFPLYPASEMEFIVKKEKIKFAVLTVQDKDAQNMADRIVKAGITGIVNMTNVLLKIPANVKAENLSVITALNLLL